MSNKLRKDEFYPVRDTIPFEQREALGVKFGAPMASLGVGVGNVHAIWTGEKRPPQKGEWYLSGAVIQAYRAPNALSTPYHIAKLVRTETVTVIRQAG